MTLFVKIAKDGKSVQVLRTVFFNNINLDEFDNRSSRFSVSEFLSMFSKNIDDSIKEKIKRVREIHDMKLSALGNFNMYDENREVIGLGYFAGDEIIEEEYAGNSVREEALQYSKRFYGSEFMKENECKLDDDKVTYFSREKEISCSEYKRLIREIGELTKVFAIRKEKNNNIKR